VARLSQRASPTSASLRGADWLRRGVRVCVSGGATGNGLASIALPLSRGKSCIARALGELGPEAVEAVRASIGTLGDKERLAAVSIVVALGEIT
jgi:hypothetical protein